MHPRRRITAKTRRERLRCLAKAVRSCYNRDDLPVFRREMCDEEIIIVRGNATGDGDAPRVRCVDPADRGYQRRGGYHPRDPHGRRPDGSGTAGHQAGRQAVRQKGRLYLKRQTDVGCRGALQFSRRLRTDLPFQGDILSHVRKPASLCRGRGRHHRGHPDRQGTGRNDFEHFRCDIPSRRGRKRRFLR